LVHVPELAAEVTFQPVRRFDFDAAILFSDILVVPEALGQGFRFRPEGGVAMDFALRDKNDFARLNGDGAADRLQYVAEAIKLIKAGLGGRTALLGFAGSPWTLANFMLDGGSAEPHARGLELFRSDRRSYNRLARLLTAAVTEFLQLQIDAGADGVQIFDSLGGLLPKADFSLASGRWIREIVRALRGQVPVIVFSKGTRHWSALRNTGAEIIGIDHEVALAEAKRRLPGVGLQGNINPALLLEPTPRAVEVETARALDIMRGRNGYIVNLGHGVPPDARLENIEALVQTVRSRS
jgi:uroporphyrinogen decarboxylase